MSLRPPTRLADTRSAERLRTVDYARMTAGTEGSIRSAIRDLVVGDAASEARVADAVFMRFHGHFVSIARSMLWRFGAGLQARLPSPSELTQEVFSDSSIRSRLVMNLSNLRREHGDDFAIRTLVQYVSQSAAFGFKDALGREARRVLKGESELQSLAQLQAAWEVEAREAADNEGKWVLVEEYLRSRYQADELEVALLRLRHHESYRSIAEIMRQEIPQSRFAGPEKRVELFCAQVVKDLQAFFGAEDGAG